MKSGRSIIIAAVSAFVALTFLAGCGSRVYAPREGSAIWYYHPQLPEAAKAVEDAQKTGKDSGCPEEFQAAENRMKEAYRVYWACRTEEGIAMAKEASTMARSLCPEPVALVLSASEVEIRQGESTTLTFAPSGPVKSATLDGKEVPVAGTTITVSPKVTTTYTGQVTGVGGPKEASVTVKVLPPPTAVSEPVPASSPAQEKKMAKEAMTVTVHFEFDKYRIRKVDRAALKKVVEFLKKNPSAQVNIEGHTDSIGTEQYNQKLSERRARAVANYLAGKGTCKQADISTIGYGESKPVADNETAGGRLKNRRAEITISQ